MTGQELYDLVKQILGGEGPNQAYILQLINLSKMIYEGSRPWKVLSANDHALTVGGSNNYTVPFPLPPTFNRYLGESTLAQGSIVLFDGVNNIQYLTEVPIENILDYKDEFGRFAVDYKNNQFFICGVVPGSFTIYQYFIEDNAPITLTTPWLRFPARFHPILAFDAAARWRLGTDYDDVNARNADDNEKMANNIFSTMETWDTELALSAINSIDYRNDQYGNFWNNNIGPRGTRA